MKRFLSKFLHKIGQGPCAFDREKFIDPESEESKLIRASLLKHVYSSRTWWKDEYFEDLPELYAKFVDRYAYARYNTAIRYLIPWIRDHYDLTGKKVLDFGCGPGATTSAFAMYCGHIYGYEISKKSIVAAKERMDILGLDNTTLKHVAGEQIITTVKEEHTADGLDVFLLYGVLEHQTVDERIDTLKTAWNLLKPGGILVVIETPNRLTYHDWHTSLLHFYHMLPLELQAKYYPRSPREDYVENMKHFMEKIGLEGTFEQLRRFGQSVSYHEFEIALGEINDLVIGDGYHECLVNLPNRTIKLQDKLLEQYFIENDIKVPRGFTRGIMDLILQKPDS